jgi:hypothetical protein
MINFPTTPTIGQEHTEAGVIWTWDGVKWTAVGLVPTYLPLTDPIVTDAPYLQLAGGTMLGPFVLEADPVAPLQPVTEQYFNKYPMIGDNRIINGDMMIDQRNNGVAGNANGYTCDRWQYQGTQAGALGWQRNDITNDPSGLALGLSYCLTASNLNIPYTPLSTDYFQFYQPIEADMVSDFAWGTPGAQPVTLSFMVTCPVGTFSATISNDNGSRSYPFTFSIPIAGIWTKIVVTIPGDTAGVWAMSGNGQGVGVHFDLGSGANYRGPAGAWASANYVGAIGADNLIAMPNGQFNITSVKLEIGTVATPYNRQSLAKSMADCQRYYIGTATYALGGSGNAGVGESFPLMFPVQMRAPPTMTVSGAGGTGWSAPIANSISQFGFSPAVTVTVTGGYVLGYSWSADAEL